MNLNPRPWTCYKTLPAAGLREERSSWETMFGDEGGNEQIGNKQKLVRGCVCTYFTAHAHCWLDIMAHTHTYSYILTRLHTHLFHIYTHKQSWTHFLYTHAQLWSHTIIHIISYTYRHKTQGHTNLPSSHTHTQRINQSLFNPYPQQLLSRDQEAQEIKQDKTLFPGCLPQPSLVQGETAWARDSQHLEPFPTPIRLITCMCEYWNCSSLVQYFLWWNAYEGCVWVQTHTVGVQGSFQPYPRSADEMGWKGGEA